jgi:anti-sigma regulatory factor (Ser/Thr protein kinase)
MAAAPQVIALNCQLGDGPPGSRLADGTPGGGDSEVAEVPEGDGSGCLGTAGGPGTRLADSRWRSYPARPDQVARVRALLAGMLGDCPAAADVILMADELVTNAVLHSRSHEPGGTFRLRILISDGDSVRIEVADAGGEWASPGGRNGAIDGSGLGGRGLCIVAALAASWGVEGDETGRTAWFTVGWQGS